MGLSVGRHFRPRRCPERKIIARTQEGPPFRTTPHWLAYARLSICNRLPFRRRSCPTRRRSKMPRAAIDNETQDHLLSFVSGDSNMEPVSQLRKSDAALRRPPLAQAAR